MLLKRIVKILIGFFILLSLSSYSIASSIDTSIVNKSRLHWVIGSESVLYGTSLYALNSLWYKDYPRSSFHFFNDNLEWLQMDKIGHATTSATLGMLGYKTLKWCGVPEKKAVWFGGSLGFIFLTTIETLDGFSQEWGASTGDLAANTFGSALFISQQLAWKEQRVILKWSFHQSEYSKYRPDLMGSNLTENMVKDYNGQTYWLSANIGSFLNKESKFPKWLNIAFGYGADGMTGAFQNSSSYNGNAIPYFTRYRQFYISPDIDFTRIPTKSKALKILFHALNFVKFPAPALEYNRENHLRFSFLCF